MPGLTKKQLEIRKTGIGGSEVAAILGLDDYKTAHDVWLEKTGRKEPEDLSNNESVELGILLEPILARKYAKINKCELIKPKETFRHEKYPWMIANPDRLIAGQKKILEIKTATYPGKIWGEEGTDIVPMKYIIQVQHYMFVMGVDYLESDIYSCVFAGKRKFRNYPIKRDKDIIDFMIPKIDKFWNYNVKKDMPPVESL
jgi:putative phage-type endonuclease